MKKTFSTIGLFIALLINPAAYASDTAVSCVRADSLNLGFLKNVEKAMIFKRSFDFDSRIRFFDKSGNQVDTCSTDLGTNNSFNCWTTEGVQGESDIVTMLLMVDSNEQSRSLIGFMEPFNLSVVQAGKTKALKFSCSR